MISVLVDTQHCLIGICVGHENGDINPYQLTSVLELSIYAGLWLSTSDGLKAEDTMLVYTLTGHFIRYILLVPGWTPFAFRLNPLWHRFNKVLETFLREFGPY